MSANEIDELGEIYSKLREFSDTTQDKPDFTSPIDNINGWVNEQKKKGKIEEIQKVGEVLKTAVNALEKFQSEDPYEITEGTLAIISSVASVAGGPYGVAISAVCSIAGAIVSASKPAKPSVVERLAQVIQSELKSFHHELQAGELSGLEESVRNQYTELRQMKVKKELQDRNLWNLFIRFLGKLRDRVNSQLEFKYELDLEKDHKMGDFVKAVVMYCRAYACFMALLTVAKKRFQEFEDGSDMVVTIDRFMDGQAKAAKQTFAFLSDSKQLTFIGRLNVSSESGNLIKMLALARNPLARQCVEKIVPDMHAPLTVEVAAEKVSRQSVKLKIKGTSFGEGLRGFQAALDALRIHVGPATTVVFINETDFPMRIVSGTVGRTIGNMKFEKDVEPRSYYDQTISSFWGTFSTGGYIKIAYDGKFSSEPAADDPSEGGNIRVIEFALDSPWASTVKINIEDKTKRGRTQGDAAYNSMKNDEGKTLYWMIGEQYYLARAEILRNMGEQVSDWASLRKFNLLPYTSKAKGTWCFVVQDFDPDQDLVEETK